MNVLEGPSVYCFIGLPKIFCFCFIFTILLSTWGFGMTNALWLCGLMKLWPVAFVRHCFRHVKASLECWLGAVKILDDRSYRIENDAKVYGSLKLTAMYRVPPVVGRPAW